MARTWAFPVLSQNWETGKWRASQWAVVRYHHQQSFGYMAQHRCERTGGCKICSSLHPPSHWGHSGSDIQHQRSTRGSFLVYPAARVQHRDRVLMSQTHWLSLHSYRSAFVLAESWLGLQLLTELETKPAAQLGKSINRIARKYLHWTLPWHENCTNSLTYKMDTIAGLDNKRKGSKSKKKKWYDVHLLKPTTRKIGQLCKPPVERLTE